MPALFVFGVTLLAAVLLSERAERSVLSTALLFLVGGFLAGPAALGLASIGQESPVVAHLSEWALFSVLLTEGMQLGFQDLRAAWQLPGRALLFGMPVTLGLTAALGRWVAGLTWPEALLVGAALSPTDPVFAAAIVGREEVPRRLRELLNIESGLNDGLALPFVIILMAPAGGRASQLDVVAGQLLLGIAIGTAITWAALSLERYRWFAVSARYEPLYAVAIGLVVFAVASLTHGNLFLAAFGSGVTLATVRPDFREKCQQFGNLIAEQLKLGGVFVIGILVSAGMLGRIPLEGYVFAVLALLLPRSVALGLALLGSPLDRRERVTAIWFGPKGFASVFYAMLILRSGQPRAGVLFLLVLLVVVISMIAHSSTDVLAARRFPEPGEGGRHPGRGRSISS